MKRSTHLKIHWVILEKAIMNYYHHYTDDHSSTWCRFHKKVTNLMISTRLVSADIIRWWKRLKTLIYSEYQHLILNLVSLGFVTTGLIIFFIFMNRKMKRVNLTTANIHSHANPNWVNLKVFWKKWPPDLRNISPWRDESRTTSLRGTMVSHLHMRGKGMTLGLYTTSVRQTCQYHARWLYLHYYISCQ